MSEESSGTGPVAGVVVGVDDSHSARAAVAWAAAAARRRGLGLHLVEVLPGPGVETGTPHGRARALLHQAQGIARTISPDLTITVRTLPGRVGPALVSYAADAGLLVVGSNGPGGPIPLSLGSILGEVTTRCRCPVILVPARRELRPRVDDAPVVVALDDGPDGRRALEFAAETAHRYGAALSVLAGTTAPNREDSGGPSVGPPPPAELDQLHDSYPGLEIRTETVTGRLGDELLNAGSRAQLIVVAARRRGSGGGQASGWTRHFLPVLSACPVAVV
ncbi:universal stress protein [Actinomycetospora endophytica]|uniref:Universal stress protein n=1 Tax=Actinomycetospora endophytica TaxID=2291215 RepID=A0ABS8P172_9PSEU|nr:universal stress protein [Actinomycetospora endophytica]MCD2191988.1 universal stress protein [Actinomycetospora endophytica]